MNNNNEVIINEKGKAIDGQNEYDILESDIFAFGAYGDEQLLFPSSESKKNDIKTPVATNTDSHLPGSIHSTPLSSNPTYARAKKVFDSDHAHRSSDLSFKLESGIGELSQIPIQQINDYVAKNRDSQLNKPDIASGLSSRYTSGLGSNLLGQSNESEEFEELLRMQELSQIAKEAEASNRRSQFTQAEIDSMTEALLSRKDMDTVLENMMSPTSSQYSDLLERQANNRYSSMSMAYNHNRYPHDANRYSAPSDFAILNALQRNQYNYANRCSLDSLMWQAEVARQRNRQSMSLNQSPLPSRERFSLSAYNNLFNRHNKSMPENELLHEEISRLSTNYQGLMGQGETDIERAATVYRTSASSNLANATWKWSGQLPKRSKSQNYSRKVFLGGVPWDSKEEDIMCAFTRFGNVSVMWPQRDGKAASTSASLKGYCYIIFEREESVNELMSNCSKDPSNDGEYFKIPSPKFRTKDVQVIPWCQNDCQYQSVPMIKFDNRHTVFIGALHGMITAEGLAYIMNQLFGTVLFAALDTDKYKYPIGSGRVTFENQKSYMRAVTANFVDVRAPKFNKLIQIDPYLEDSRCNSCDGLPGIYFCRSFECFRYFCPNCWQHWHEKSNFLAHKPLRRTFKPLK